MTSDLARRLEQHWTAAGSRFAKRYWVRRLVYYEEYATAMEAIERQKQIKRWRREKKVKLIEAINPTWRDLVETRPYF